MQDGFAGRGGEAGGHVDQVAAQGGATGHGVATAGEGAGGAQQVMRNRRAVQPGAVGGEQPLGEGMCAGGPSIKSATVVSMMACFRWVMSASGGQGGVGHKRVMAPHRKQRIRACARLEGCRDGAQFGEAVRHAGSLHASVPAASAAMIACGASNRLAEIGVRLKQCW